MNAQKSTFGLNQVLIILLALATALIHLVLLNMLIGKVDVLFTLNGLGFLGLLAAYLLPLPFAKDNRGLVRWALIGFTLVTILAYLIMGRPYMPLGIATKVIEAALIVFLLLDGRR